MASAAPAAPPVLWMPPAEMVQAELARRRTLAARRKYAGHPAAYIRDTFGYVLTPGQERGLELIEANDRVLLPSANNQGKTWLLGAYGLYRFDAVAALEDEENGLVEQGAKILLPGPDANTIFATVYSEMLAHARRAEARGRQLPGDRSEKSVLWRVRPQWDIEAFNPAKSVQETVAHTASGRHHRNQVALMEESQGIDERVFKAVEGMCSATGNKIVCALNPTEARGPAYERARRGGYKVLHLSALDHPNVRSRQVVVPAAIGLRVVEQRIREECLDLGAHPPVYPNPDKREFVYALPEKDAPERGVRADSNPGHPDAEPRVYRPSPAFEAQVLGEWPSTSDAGLFNPASWDAAVTRANASPEPTARPDRVGADVAREGADDSYAAPSWGRGAEALLRAYAEAMKESKEAVLRLQATGRVRVGALRMLPKGDGPTVAQALSDAFPEAGVYNIDEGGVGASVLDHSARVLNLPAEGVSFAAAAPDPTPGEPWSENMRTAMYVRFAKLVALGLADVPDDAVLREEVMAHRLLHRARVVTLPDGTKVRKPTVLLVSKDEVKKLIGRSPDKADAAVLSVVDPAPVLEAAAMWIPPTSTRTSRFGMRPPRR